MPTTAHAAMPAPPHPPKKEPTRLRNIFRPNRPNAHPGNVPNPGNEPSVLAVSFRSTLADGAESNRQVAEREIQRILQLQLHPEITQMRPCFIPRLVPWSCNIGLAEADE